MLQSTKMIACLLLALVAMAANVQVLNAASIKRIEGFSGSNVGFLLSGPIEKGDMNELLSAQATDNSPSTILFLESSGGDADEGLIIAKFVHNLKWSTAVGPKGYCYSACATIWIGGAKRYLGQDSQVGFHDVYDKNGPSASGNAMVGAFYGQLGLRDRVIEYLTEAPADKLNPMNLKVASLIGLEVFELDRLTSPVDQPQVSTGATPHPSSTFVKSEPSETSTKPDDNRWTPNVKASDANIHLAKEFVLGMYLNSENEPKVETLYTSSVRYNGDLKTRADLLQETTKYRLRWPVRHLTLIEKSLEVKNAASANTFLATFQFDFDESNTSHRVTGTGEAELVLSLENGRLLIAAETNRVLRRKRQ